MRHPRNIALFICFLTGLAAAACGTPPGLKEGIDGAFVRAAPTWDLNHDGNVTCDEWKAYAASLFKDFDLDHDGKLTPDEFAAMGRADRLFQTVDLKYFDTTNKGYVTLVDITDHPNPAFEQLDKEKTCVLKQHQLRSATSERPKQENPGVPGGPGGH